MQPSTPDRTERGPGGDMNVLRKEIIIPTGTPPLGRYKIGFPVVTLSSAALSPFQCHFSLHFSHSSLSSSPFPYMRTLLVSRACGSSWISKQSKVIYLMSITREVHAQSPQPEARDEVLDNNPD